MAKWLANVNINKSETVRILKRGQSDGRQHVDEVRKQFSCGQFHSQFEMSGPETECAADQAETA